MAQLQCANTEIAVIERLFPPLPGLTAYKKAIQELTQEANATLFTVVEDTWRAFKDGLEPDWTPALVREETVSFRERLFALHDDFFNANRALMIEELERDQLEIEAA